MSADGAWTYTLDNSDPAVQALQAGQTLHDTFTVTTVGRHRTQLVTITITGTNERGGDHAATSSATVIEAGDGVTASQTATGNLALADEDNGENQLQPIAAGTAGSQRLRHLRRCQADGVLDLHARQQRPRRAGAAGRPDAAATPSR